MQKYILRSDTILDDQGKPHTVYGIELPSAQLAVRDVFYHRSEAQAFINKCNKLNLSPIHLYEVIEDLL